MAHYGGGHLDEKKEDTVRVCPRHLIYVLLRSQLKAKLFDFLDENRLIFVVLSGRFQRLERDFSVLF